MLKAVVQSLDGIPEHFHELYTFRNGQYELTGVEGTRTQADVDRLQSALDKERRDHKAVRERFALLGDRKVEDILAQLDRIPELEALADGNNDEEKINQLVEARINSRIAPIQRNLDSANQQLAQANEQIQGYEKQTRQRMIHDQVREAIAGAKGFQQTAIDDALVFAERMLQVTEDGRVVTTDQSGVTPGIEASVWLTEMQQKKPHWWGVTQGGGAGGNSGGNAFTKNPWSAEHWNMTEQGRILKADRNKAEQLAKSAGTTIGGKRPEPRQ